MNVTTIGNVYRKFIILQTKKPRNLLTDVRIVQHRCLPGFGNVTRILPYRLVGTQNDMNDMGKRYERYGPKRYGKRRRSVLTELQNDISKRYEKSDPNREIPPYVQGVRQGLEC